MSEDPNLVKYPTNLVVNSEYGSHDWDTTMFLHHFNEPPGAKILEVGANEEASCRILADNGYKVMGVDLRPHDFFLPHNYIRWEGDFLEIAPFLSNEFDAVFSTSALEHFGIHRLYGYSGEELDHDVQSVKAIWSSLKYGGAFYLTVPYGKDFLVESDWRVYNRDSLRDRIIRNFTVEKKIFFLSGGCNCPTNGDNIVREEDADTYSGKPPHVTVFLKLRK